MVSKVQVFAARISNQYRLITLRDDMTSVMPLTIIGSIFMLTGNFPVPAFTDWLDSIGLLQFFNKASDSTSGMIGLGVTFLITYNLAKRYKVDTLSAGLVAISTFVMLMPILQSEAGNGFPTEYLGSSGLFVGIIVSIVSAEMFQWFVRRDITVKIPDTVPPNVSRASTAIVPGFFIILAWFFILVFLRYTGIDDIHTLIANTITKLLGLLIKTLPGIIFATLVQCFFWMFGTHSTQVTGPIIEPLLLQNSDANQIAYQIGQELPNIITHEFLYNSVSTGGAGCVVALAILIFLSSKGKGNRTLGKLSIAPVSLQVAESLLFGFLTILNFKVVIPFVTAPAVITLITYYIVKFGIVSKPIGAVVPWTTPPVISGFLATNDELGGTLIQVVAIAVNMPIYYPLFKLDDNKKLKVGRSLTERNTASSNLS